MSWFIWLTGSLDKGFSDLYCIVVPVHCTANLRFYRLRNNRWRAGLRICGDSFVYIFRWNVYFGDWKSGLHIFKYLSNLYPLPAWILKLNIIFDTIMHGLNFHRTWDRYYLVNPLHSAVSVVQSQYTDISIIHCSHLAVPHSICCTAVFIWIPFLTL